MCFNEVLQPKNMPKYMQVDFNWKIYNDVSLLLILCEPVSLKKNENRSSNSWVIFLFLKDA